MSKHQKQLQPEESFFTDEDWDMLLPGKEIVLGKKHVVIKPLSLSDFVYAVRKLTEVNFLFAEAGIDRNNFSSREKIGQVTEILMEHFPEIVSKSCGIPVSDLRRLPFARVIEIVDAALEVNLESQKGFEKNLPSLVAKIDRMVAATSRAQ